MISKRQLLFLFIFCIFLPGCADVPMMLGVDSLEWSSYSPERQKQLLANYRQITKERESIIAAQEDKQANNIFLVINIYGGKVMFPPSFINWQDYKPVQFTISNGQCSRIEIVNKSDKTIKTELFICFDGKVLYLDPSRYDFTKKLGSISIYSSPLWLTGFVYKGINSNGYVRMSNVTIEIKQEEVSDKKSTISS